MAYGIQVSLLPSTSPKLFQYIGTIEDKASLQSALVGSTAMCHLAAVSDDADFETALCPANIVGLHRVLEVCRSGNVKRLVPASSGKIYFHRNSDYPIRLKDPPQITCNYGATKLFLKGAAEVFSQDSAGCPTIVLRFAWCPRTETNFQAMAVSAEELFWPTFREAVLPV